MYGLDEVVGLGVPSRVPSQSPLNSPARMIEVDHTRVGAFLDHSSCFRAGGLEVCFGFGVLDLLPHLVGTPWCRGVGKARPCFGLKAGARRGVWWPCGY